MSMSAVGQPWLWELLDWNCGIDEGRTAYVSAQNLLVSSYKVTSETGTIHQIKTITSGCTVILPSEDEEAVLSVTEKRMQDEKAEYLTKFADGHSRWLASASFISDDGTVTAAWLSFVTKEDLLAAFSSYTAAQLKVILFLLFRSYPQCS